MSKATVMTDTDRIVRWLRDHPGASVMEIRFALFISGVTQRMSDARKEGYEFTRWRDDKGTWRYRVREPGQGNAVRGGRMIPQRIQRKRTKGWRMPEGAVYVGRPTRWGNPVHPDWIWTAAACRAFGYPSAPAWRAAMAVALYRWWMDGVPVVASVEAPIELDPEPVEMTEGSVGGAMWLPGNGVIHLPRRPSLAPLRGRDLACWCPLDQPCHADVLLELANR